MGLRGKDFIVEPATGSHLLLRFLWEDLGGVKKIRELVPGTTTQDFVNWRLRGRVPLKFCNLVSKSLKIPVWGLNYPEMKLFFCGKGPSWEESVHQYEFEKAKEKQILTLPEPI